jgi:hypothetical protein
MLRTTGREQDGEGVILWSNTPKLVNLINSAKTRFFKVIQKVLEKSEKMIILKRKNKRILIFG